MEVVKVRVDGLEVEMMRDEEGGVEYAIKIETRIEIGIEIRIAIRKERIIK